MYFMDYDSVKLTNYVQRFCIISRVRNGVAEFTLLVQLVNNGRACAPKAKHNHKKPIYGQKIIMPRFSFVKNFFQKIFWRICRPSPKKKRLPEGSLAELMKIALFAD